MKIVFRSVWFCAFMICMISCSFKKPKNSILDFISSELGISVKDGLCTFEINEYGKTINGDGVCFYKIEFMQQSDKSESIAQTIGWHVLPLPEIFNKLVEEETYMPFLKDVHITIPYVCNGYYYYKNRYKGIKDKYRIFNSEIDLFQNFTFALYDLHNHILYFYALDT